MATNSFDDVLRQARSLSFEEQERLVRELSQPAAPPNGEQYRTLYDALNARGMIGCLDGPPDLSTNPKYMEGFGQDAQ